MAGAQGAQHIDDAARDACGRAGVEWKPTPADGRWHRLDLTDDRRGKGDGSLKLFPDGEGGTVENWKTGYQEHFFVTHSQPLTDEQLAKRAALRKQAELEREQALAEARGRAERILRAADPLRPGAHPYLTRKAIQPHGALVERGAKRGEGFEDALIIPVYGSQGELLTIQRIFADGTKRFVKGASPAGGFYIVHPADGGPILTSEGFSTAATLAESTLCMSVCAFSRGNLLSVTRTMQEMFPGREVIICGDYDRDGIKAARAASEATGALAIIPDLDGLGLDKGDFNDVAAVAGQAEVARQIRRARKTKTPPGGAGLSTGGDCSRPEDETSKKPMTQQGESGKGESGLEWLFEAQLPITHPPQLIKRILPREGLAIMGGQSGAGKTFCAIAMAIALASGRSYFGYPVRERVGVIYIAAEGRAVVGARFFAAKKAAGIDESLPIAVILRPPDLNPANPITFSNFAVQLKGIVGIARQRFGMRVGAVFLDTVSAGIEFKDEDDNAEAAQACRCLRMLSDPLEGVLIAVHHFGKDAGRGLRGASALKANSDHVISILADRDEAKGDTSGRSMHIIKNLVGEEGLVSSFELQSVLIGVNQYGEDEFSCAIKPVEADPDEQTAPAPRHTYQHIARVAIYESINNPTVRHIMGDGPLMRCVTMEQIKKEFTRRWPSENRTAGLNAWKRAFNFIRETGEFGVEVMENETVWVWIIKSKVVEITTQDSEMSRF